MMMSMIRFLLIAAVLLIPSAARADYFLWQDAASGLTITFPDTWKTISNLKDDDVLTIMAPSDNDRPVCRVRISPDRRYVIFPARYGKDVQKTAVSIPFWKQYMAEYEEYDIDKVYDGGGLGRWFASYALASYGAHDGTVAQKRRGLMFASLYADKLYILECSTLNHAYERWAHMFQSIVKSVDFKKAYHELPTGEYANFLKGADLYFWAQTGPEGTTAY